MESNPPAAVPTAPRRREHYLVLLAWSFSIFNAVRVLTYLPTLWAIHESGRSNQHSLLTWLAWTGANLTMALWLYEQSGQRLDRSVAENFCNAAMCLLTSCVIVWYRG